jgi:hypothetical protein
MTKLDIEAVATEIGVPVSEWPGNCYAIASLMVDKGYGGALRYGHWLGPVSEGSMFYGRVIVRHGWIEAGDIVIDPTRWVFENNPPYIWCDHDIYGYYDAAGDSLRQALERPAPLFDPTAKRVKLDIEGEVADFVYSAIRGETVTIDHVYWLANLSLKTLGDFAVPVYLALKHAGYRAAIPIDNYRLILE